MVTSRKKKRKKRINAKDKASSRYQTVMYITASHVRVSRGVHELQTVEPVVEDVAVVDAALVQFAVAAHTRQIGVALHLCSDSEVVYTRLWSGQRVCVPTVYTRHWSGQRVCVPIV
jgi:hypothetical protein